MSPKPQRCFELCLLRWSPRTPGTVCVWSRASFPRKRDGGVEQWARLTPGVPPVGGGVLAVRRRCPDGRKTGRGVRLPETAGGQSPPLASPDTGCVSAWGGEAEPGELRGVRISISRFPSPLSFPRTVALCGLILFLCLCSLGSVSSAALGKCGLSHGCRAGDGGAGHRGGRLSFTSPPCLLRGHVSQGTLSRLLPQSEASSQLLPRGPHYRVRRFIRLQEPQDSFMLGMLALMLFTRCIMLI